MKSNTDFFKLIFGLIIFAFSISLAYFTAHYIETTQATIYTSEMAYWLTILGFAGLYVIVGILVSSIFPISLGFLFCATELLIHIFIGNYYAIPSIYKVSLVGIIIAILEILALIKMPDPEVSEAISAAKNIASIPPSGPKVN